MRVVLLFCVCWLSIAASGAAELGRLFFSPAERVALERARHAQPEVSAEAAPEPEIADVILEPVADEPEITETVTVNGYVRRSNGPETVWVNGMDSFTGNFGELGIDSRGVRLEQQQVRVPLGESRRGILLKPGQAFDPIDDEITEAYEQQPPLPE